MEDIFIRLIAEAHVLEVNLTPGRRQLDGTGLVLNIRRNIEQFENTCPGSHSPLKLRILHGKLQNGVEETLDV